MTCRDLWRFACAAAALVAVACDAQAPAQPDAGGERAEMLRPVPLPSLTGMSEAVAEQIQERYEAVQRSQQRHDRNLAAAYGELGKVLLGAKYMDAAEAALANATAVDRADVRWPYYLAHVYRAKGAAREAAAWFEAVLKLDPAHSAALVWLADTHLSQGRIDDAEPLLQRARDAHPESVAALYHSGRLALMRSDFAGAVRFFERGLELDPTAAPIHYPLATAYRALGDSSNADRHLARRARDNAVVSPADPLMEEVERAVGGPLALEVRGVEALNRGDWHAAADAFRKGTALAPRSPALHHRLGTALAMMGRADEARRAFEAALAASPTYAKAHYSLGLIDEDRGADDDAIARYTAAVDSEPSYAQARLRLADLLRRRAQLVAALAEYDRVLQSDPTLADAAVGRALALVALGRDQEARDQLTTAVRAYPDHVGIPLALARLLAASPDERVRNGSRALELARTAMKNNQGIEVGETLAMALAETGNFTEAAAVQRDLITAARRGGEPALARALEENLRLYEARKASRTPWRGAEVGSAR